jgi:hypothetical protein
MGNVGAWAPPIRICSISVLYQIFYELQEENRGSAEILYHRATEGTETHREDDVKHEGHKEREGPRRKPTREGADDTERR